MKFAAVLILVVGSAAQVQGPFGNMASPNTVISGAVSGLSSSGPFSGYSTRSYSVASPDTFISGAVSGLQSTGPFSGYGTRGYSVASPNTILSGLTSSGPFTSGYGTRGYSVLDSSTGFLNTAPLSGFGSANPYGSYSYGVVDGTGSPYGTRGGFSIVNPFGARGYSLGVVDGSVPFGARGYGYGVTVAAGDKGSYTVKTIGSAKCVADSMAFWTGKLSDRMTDVASFPSHVVSWSEFKPRTNQPKINPNQPKSVGPSFGFLTGSLTLFLL
jgi:hypothetical protein